MKIDQISEIKKWLTLDFDVKDSYCPFNHRHGAGEICLVLFPKIQEEKANYSKSCGLEYRCPCGVYNVAYVSRKAREVVEKHE
jgi:hypothetical protein